MGSHTSTSASRELDGMLRGRTNGASGGRMRDARTNPLQVRNPERVNPHFCVAEMNVQTYEAKANPLRRSSDHVSP